MQKEYKVGEEIKLGNVTLLVEELDGFDCDECFFDRICTHNLFEEISDMVGSCTADEREGKDNVMFIKVDEE